MLQVPIVLEHRATITHCDGLNEWIQCALMIPPHSFKSLSVDLAADVYQIFH